MKTSAGLLVVFLLASGCGPQNVSRSIINEETGGRVNPPPQSPTLQPPPTEQGPTEGNQNPQPPPNQEPQPPIRDCGPAKKFDDGECNQSVGFYADEDGRLTVDLTFPLQGSGFVKIFRPRNRGYAASDMVQIISYAADELARRFPKGERVQIGDVAKRGGGQLSLHASHRNGLDADISFLKKDGKEQNPDNTNGFEETFVKNGKVTANFDVVRNFEFLKILVETQRINRIFVDENIKAKICKEVLAKPFVDELEKETLRRLRHVDNHQDHMHVRIKCPSRSPACVPQEEVPEGTGC